MKVSPENQTVDKAINEIQALADTAPARFIQKLRFLTSFFAEGKTGITKAQV